MIIALKVIVAVITAIGVSFVLTSPIPWWATLLISIPMVAMMIFVFRAIDDLAADG